jgi:hypothetical protein
MAAGESSVDRQRAFEKAAIGRRQVEDFRQYMSSRAAEKFRKGHIDELTFHDACAFWGISPRSTASQFNSRLAHFKSILELFQNGGANGGFRLRQGSTTYSQDDISLLTELSETLEKRFADEISFILRRTDER